MCMEKLTPAYGVFYVLNDIGGNPVVWIDTERKDTNGYLLTDEFSRQVKPFVEPINKAIHKAKQLTKEMPEHEIYVYQVGFMERGFKAGESTKEMKKKVYHYIPIGKKANF